MDIKGKKYLDANWYDKIVIMERDGKIECNVSAKNEIKNFIKGNFSISKNIDGCQYKSEACLKIVNYFLRYGLVTKLEENVDIPNIYSNRFICVTTDSRKLYLSINVDKNTNEIINSIMNKYYLDKHKKIYETLNNYDVCYIDIRQRNNFSYDIYDDLNYDANDEKYIKTGKKAISINYLRNIKKEYDFVLDLVKYLGNGSLIHFSKKVIKEIYSKEKLCGFNIYINGLHIYCDNLSILDDIEKVVKKNNEDYYKKEKSKTLQLKINGLF